MKHKLLLFSILLSAGILFIKCKSDPQASNTTKPKKTVLLQDNDLQNWEIVLKDTSINPGLVFAYADGVLKCSGKPFGYIQTKEEFSNYSLHVEWRWPDTVSNSGVFVHKTGDNVVWPICIEAQLWAGRAGDVVLINGATVNETTDSAQFVVVDKLHETSENAVGEWNSYDIKCLGDSITLTVNGQLQNKVSGASVSKGKICLQSEGKDIEFRNIYLEEL